MKKFKKDAKGAITVLVALLLIPAILITGIGVDLAAVYGARTALRNADQMGANAVLTKYDSLLQELYGLYGVASSDSDLTTMVDTYVRATLLQAYMDEKALTGRKDGKGGLA